MTIATLYIIIQIIAILALLAAVAEFVIRPRIIRSIPHRRTGEISYVLFYGFYGEPRYGIKLFSQPSTPK